MNQLILGDNLEIMREMESESIDLIYLDPPFFSNRSYEVIWGDEGEIRSFDDYWNGGMDQFLMWLKLRVAEMHRLLKPTGSIYLHCDWHADAYIRVHILDKIFGMNNFRNHIIWQRTRNPKGSQFEKRCLGIATDTIYWYSKTDNFFFNEKAARGQLQDGELAKKYPNFDEKGRYYQGPIIRGSSMGLRPNLVYEYKGYTPINWGWRMTKEKLIELDNNCDLGWSNNGKPYRKLRPENDKGNPIYNFWNDINRLYSNNIESIGYPTQKPEKLLDRIILLSSKEGDVVMDPFVGGGTTVVVADRLKRNWLGIDQSVAAVKVTELRLNKQQGKLIGQVQDMYSHDFTLRLHKYDYDALFNQDPFEFEKWIIVQFGEKFKTGCIPHGKKGGDKGCDGKTKEGTPIQVKQSENIGINVIKNFTVSAKQYDRLVFEKNQKNNLPCGYIIAFSFGKGAVNEAARFLNEENIIIKLVRVDEIVEIAKKPKLNVELKDLGTDEKGMKQIEFTANAVSESGIEFYAYDFDYNEKTKIFNAEIMLDKVGKQTYKFKPGTHNIAVKAVDNEGMEAVEVVKVKVNGKLSEL